MKQNILFLTFLTIINFYSCNNNKDMIIDSIDSEFNKQLLTGDGLDPNLFNTKDILQYYQVSYYDDLSEKELVLKIDKFIIENYKNENIKANSDFTLLFYKKENMVDYSNYLYESARDNINGGIAEYKENLVVKVLLKKVNEKTTRNFTYYVKNEVVFNTENTLNFSK